MNNYNPVSNFQTFILSHEDELTHWDNFTTEQNNVSLFSESQEENKDKETSYETIESMLEEIYASKDISLKKFYYLINKTLETPEPMKVDFNTINHDLEENNTHQHTKLV